MPLLLLAAAAGPSLRLLSHRSPLVHHLSTAAFLSRMTRTKAQGRGAEAAAAAAADTDVAPSAAGSSAPPKFSPALTAMDPSQYDAQLEAKVQRITRQFAEFNPPALQVHRSCPEHYRMRAEFRVWHKGEDLFYVMFEKNEAGKNQEVRMDSFPVASKLLNELMGLLRERVRATPVLRHKLFQANFHTTLSGQSMVSLIYHKKLNDTWKEEAQQLREVLAKAPSSTAPPHVIGRSRGQKLCLDADEVQEVLTVDGQQLRQVQVEASFSQPNGSMCQHMLSWARSVTAGSAAGDLLELYCGNGNFAVALAPNFRKVVATEVSKSSVAAAKRNFELNGVGNVFVARMSSEEFTAAWKENRIVQRLEGLDLQSLGFTTLLVDPPRAGLDPQTVQLLRDFQSVVYISCNPDTLHANLAEVKDFFEVKRFAMFDQFPYTHHVECGVLLSRRQPSQEQQQQQQAVAADGQQQTEAEAAAGEDGRGAKRKAEDGAA